MTHLTAPVSLVPRSLASLLLVFALACDEGGDDTVNSWDQDLDTESDDFDDFDDLEPLLDIPHDDSESWPRARDEEATVVVEAEFAGAETEGPGEPLQAVPVEPNPCGPKPHLGECGETWYTAIPPSSSETPPLGPVVDEFQSRDSQEPMEERPDGEFNTIADADQAEHVDEDP